MKKKLVLLLVVIGVMLMLVSCDMSFIEEFMKSIPLIEPKTADALWNNIDKRMSSVKAYDADVDMKMEFSIGDYRTFVNGAGRTIIMLDGNGDYTYYFSDSKTSLFISGKNLKEEGYTLVSYDNGKLYIGNTDVNGKGQKIVGEITKNDFQEYISTDGMMDDWLSQCVKSEFKKVDGGWELKRSGYTASAVKELAASFSLDDIEEVSFDDVKDLNVVITTDSDYYVSSIKIDFVFDAEEYNAPKLGIEMTYKAYGDSVKKYDKLDTESFTEVDDIMFLKRLPALIEERQNADNGKFTLRIIRKVSPGDKSSLETDTVTYGKDEYGYFFDITASVDSTPITMRYSNGKLYTSGTGVQNSAVNQTDEEAKAFVNGLIDSGNFIEATVTDIEVPAVGVYRLVCNNLDDSLYSEVFSGSRISYKSAIQTTIYTVKDGKIKSIEGCLTIKGTYSGSNMAFYEIYFTLNFE